jgi:predicted dehydrogenase
MAIRTALIDFGIGGRFFHEPFLATNSSYLIDAVVTSSPERRAAAARHYRVLDSTEEAGARADEFDRRARAGRRAARGGRQTPITTSSTRRGR